MSAQSALSIIIPAYNENEHIITLIDALKQAGNYPIIVVDDCSKEEFTNIYREIDGITLIRHEVNKGKSAALQTGIDATDSEFVLVLDADLIGITPNHIQFLLSLVPQYDIMCLVRGDDSLLFKIGGSTFITRGEHLIRRTTIQKYWDTFFDGARWGFDNNVNDLIRKEPIRSVFCELEHVHHVVKSQKYSFFTGMMLDFKMFYEVPIKKYKLIFWISTYIALLPKILRRIKIPASR